MQYFWASKLTAMPKMPEQSFAISYDLPSKIISTVVVAALAIVFIITGNAWVGVLDLCITVLTYAHSPQSYVVSGASILIRRLAGTVRIPLDSVRELRAAIPEDFRGCIRLWASGGFFGYYGLFRTARLGRCTWYVTNRRNSVILFTNQRTVVLSPNDVAGFLASVRSVAHVPETTSGHMAEAGDTPKRRVPVGAWIGGAVAILFVGAVASFVCFALMYSPGPPKLTLTSNSLTIHDRFYPDTVDAADVDVSGIKIVDIQTDHVWTPTERTNGFANDHYHSGWFRVAGGSVRMYWADGTRLVLLPPRRSGAAVLLQVNDPEQFVDKVRQEWAHN
jgi:hypothetical protein